MCIDGFMQLGTDNDRLQYSTGQFGSQQISVWQCIFNSPEMSIEGRDSSSSSLKKKRMKERKIERKEERKRRNSSQIIGHSMANQGSGQSRLLLLVFQL